MYLESHLWLKKALTFFFLSFLEEIFFQILFVFHILCIGNLFQLNGFKAALGFGVSKTSTFVGTVGGAFGPPFMDKPGGGGGGGGPLPGGGGGGGGPPPPGGGGGGGGILPPGPGGGGGGGGGAPPPIAGGGGGGGGIIPLPGGGGGGGGGGAPPRDGRGGGGGGGGGAGTPLLKTFPLLLSIDCFLITAQDGHNCKEEEWISKKLVKYSHLDSSR